MAVDIVGPDADGPAQTGDSRVASRDLLLRRSTAPHPC